MQSVIDYLKLVVVGPVRGARSRRPGLPGLDQQQLGEDDEPEDREEHDDDEE